MSPNCSLKLDEIRWLLWLYLGWIYWLRSRTVDEQREREIESVDARRCGQRMNTIQVIDQFGRVLYNHSQAYLDSS